MKRDEEAREGYAQDESDTGHYLPDLVVLAESAEHVSAVLKLCRAAKVPVTPCGARTGKSGGCLTVEGGVALSLERMTRIVEISKDNLTARVQPGVVLGEFMKAVEAQGLFYPPDPNSLEWCTLGGNIAENAGGPRALKYGVTRDYVLGMDWVMRTASASAWAARPSRAWRATTSPGCWWARRARWASPRRSPCSFCRCPGM